MTDLTNIMVIAAMTAASATAKSAPAAGRTLPVCFEEFASVENLALAQGVANKLLAPAGVVIDWRLTACPNGAVRIIFRNKTPDSLKPGALAFALPYEGTRIEVFSDRVAKIEHNLGPYVLGYAFAHEITHILQGVSRHSDDGVMKAVWNLDDYADMRMMRLTLAKEDVAMIHAAMAFRERCAAKANDVN